MGNTCAGGALAALRPFLKSGTAWRRKNSSRSYYAAMQHNIGIYFTGVEEIFVVFLLRSDL
jgi:hypothetical protein